MSINEMVSDLRVRTKLHNSNSNRRAGDMEFRSCNRQSESPRSRTSRVDIEDLSLLRYGRSMRMPRHDDSETGRFRVQIQLRKIVENVDLKFARLQDFEV